MVRFDDHPEFRPNLTPEQVMKMGSFGGTYWRPIHSSITGKNYRNQHKKYKWDVDDNKMTKPWDQYDIKINKYKVKVGQTLEEWEKAHWITSTDPYGFFQWYCNFYEGRRTKDDDRQIKRWLGVAGPNGRFRKALINEIRKKNGSYNDFDISPARRQTLQHWGYKLTKSDFENST
jgi:hypothetical protein